MFRVPTGPSSYVCPYTQIVDNPPPLARHLLAELVGSAFLAAVVVGSGALTPGPVGVDGAAR